MTAAAKVVLSIDDERAILSLREIILKLAGYEVFSALNGREGLKVFDSHAVDIVLLDYCMPEMNGEQVAVEMKRRRPYVPIIMASAYMDLPESALASVDSFLTKGEGPERLLKRMDELLLSDPALKQDVSAVNAP